MKPYKPGMLGILMSFSLISVGGCGASVVTALNKIASGQICQLSAAEITILNQAAVNFGTQQNPPVTVPTLTDAQTQAVVDFLQLNQLCTITDLEGLTTRLQQGPPLQGLSALEAAFPNLGSTGSNPQALTGILHSTLGIGSESVNAGGGSLGVGSESEDAGGGPSRGHRHEPR